MREIRLHDLEVELAQSAAPEEKDESPEAVIVFLLPKGSPFESYLAGIFPDLDGSRERVRALRIDTAADPAAPARFALEGAPGLALFIGGKQVAAFAVPFASAMGSMVKSITDMVRNLLPPPGARGGARP